MIAFYIDDYKSSITFSVFLLFRVEALKIIVDAYPNFTYNKLQIQGEWGVQM